MILRVCPLHFEFRALDPISFPPGRAANVFRGAFGEIFRGIACLPDCPGARICSRASVCPYSRMFEPRATRETRGPSGFEDQLRPFALRAASIDGRGFGAGELFSLDINVFDPDLPAMEYFQRAFERLGAEGLGAGRAKVKIVDAKALPVVKVDFAVIPEPVHRITVEFLTPTQLKAGGQVLREPRFDVLVKRARDRVAGLIGTYQSDGSPIDLDYRGMGERAGLVRTTGARIEQRDFERRSSRTGQTHGLGGFVGEADYEGELVEFLPWLEALWWTGVGRLTVWGNGLVRARAS